MFYAKAITKLTLQVTMNDWFNCLMKWQIVTELRSILLGGDILMAVLVISPMFPGKPDWKNSSQEV